MSNELRNRFLMLTLCVGVFACDNEAPREVPSGAGRGLSPAKIEVQRPKKPAPDEKAVVAWVNSEPIYRSEIEAHMGRLRSQHADEQRGRVLQAVIDEKLLDQWSQKQMVTDEDVDAEINASIERVFRSKAALAAHVTARQSTMPAYRADVRRRLAERTLTPQQPPTLDDDAALHTLYREVASRPPTVTSFRVSSVLIPKTIPTDEVRRLLAEAREESGFAHLPGRRSDLGWVEEKALNAGLAQALQQVEAPGRSEPIQTPSGLEVYWVWERATKPTPHFKELEPMLRRRIDSIALANSRAKLLRELRESADIRLADQPESRSDVKR